MSREVVYKSGFDEVWIDYDEKKIGVAHFLGSEEKPGITIWRTNAKKPFYELDAFGKKTIYGYEKLLEMIKDISEATKTAEIAGGNELPNVPEVEKLIRNQGKDRKSVV